MSLTTQLVESINAKPVNDADLQAASLSLLDALASAWAGSRTPVGEKLLSWASSNGSAPRTQAFLLGSLTHITETDDLHRASVTHPGCIVVPALIALAHQRQSSDRDVLESMLRGVEAICRVGMSVGPEHYKVWHNTATCGPFGSAMAAASLLNLTPEQTVFALGNAGTQSSGLWQFLESGAMSKHIHAGRGSEAGVLAAELAALDVTGAERILEGEQGFYVGLCADPDASRLEIAPADRWQLHESSIKPWPSCRHTHPAIDAALEVQQQLGNSTVSSISVDTYAAALHLCDRGEPVNEYQAKFSIQHCVASALLQGEVNLGSFDDEARTDSAALCGLSEVRLTEPYKSAYPKAWGARVQVTTSDNRELIATREHCKGDPEAPLDADEMVVKAMDLLQYGGLDRSAARALCDRVLAMPENKGHTNLLPDFVPA